MAKTETKRKIADRILERLGVAREESEASPWAYNKAEQAVDDARDELGDLVWWDAEKTPIGAASAFSLYAAGMVADVFVTEEKALLFERRMNGAHQRLSRFCHQPDNSRTPTPIQSF